MLTDAERAIFAEKLGSALVELLPCHDDVPEDERRYWLFARCSVGDWSKDLQVRHVRRIDEPGEARESALKMLSYGFVAAAPYHLPVRA